VKVEVKELDGLKRELTIAVEADQVNQQMETLFRDVQKKANLKGFRPGKAPMNVIKEAYGDSVKADAIDELIKKTYPQAVDEKALNVASHPTITNLDFNDDGSFYYKAEVEVMPSIEKIDYEGIELVEPKVEVEDKEVDEFMEHLRQRYAEFRTLSRPAGENDTVVLDLEKTADETNAIEESKFENSQVDLSNPNTIKEFKEQLPGMAAGDEKDIQVVYADDYPDEKFAGAKITYKTKVKEVKERILPEINDAFAKQTKQAETALELRMKIREEIEKQKKESLGRAKRQQIIGQLTSKNEVEVPDGMLDRYLDGVVQDMKKEGGSFDEAEVRKQYRPIGVDSIRWHLLSHRLAEMENITVEGADLEAFVKRFAEGYQMDAEQAKQVLTQSGRLNDIRESILEDKVLDFLTSKAKVVKPKE
jgi:trigger factor